VASKQSAHGPATADAARGLQDALFELKVECPVKVSHKALGLSGSTYRVLPSFIELKLAVLAILSMRMSAINRVAQMAKVLQLDSLLDRSIGR